MLGEENRPSPEVPPRPVEQRDPPRSASAEGLESPVYAPAEKAISQFLQLFESGTPGKAKAGMLRDFCAVLEAADCRWLLGANPSLLRRLAVALSYYAAPLQWEPEGEDAPSNGSSSAAAADRVSEVNRIFSSILDKVEAAKSLEEIGPAVISSVLRQVTGPMFIYAVTHLAERPWTKPSSRSLARELLDSLLHILEYKTISEFLRGAHEDEEAWFVVVMHCLKPELTKETWQRNPGTKDVFFFVLQQVQRPCLGHHLEKVLPASLLLSDDYRVENKILGVHCLHHIIRNVPAAILCQFNRAQVIYHALFNHLYIRDAQLMQVVLLCILDLLPVLKRAPQDLPNPPVVTPPDQVLQLLLTHMEAESQLPLRRTYARNLPAFVERLGIRIVRHLKRLQRVIVGYLEISDGPEEVSRLAMLETLKCTIEHAWPRMTCRLAVLLKALLRMMWDVITDRSTTPEPVKEALLWRATECLLLLNRCSEGQVKVLLQGIYHSCENEDLKECLSKLDEGSAQELQTGINQTKE